MLTFNQKLSIKQAKERTMQVSHLVVPKLQAEELYKKYKTHLNYESPRIKEDQEIMRTYQLIARGNVVIQAIESVKQAGLTFEGFPRLALMRADKKECFCEMTQNGGAIFTSKRWSDAPRNTIIFRPGTFPNQVFSKDDFGRKNGSCLLPIIPAHLRPKRGMQNYHILWEAEWKRIPPRDPYLLRQIGKGDMWLVVAAWELTEVERAAMATRINAA